MAFCIKCGERLPEGAKFCANCGSSVNVANSSDINQSRRRTVYDGEIHKCPNCGEVLPPLTLTCPSCGYEVRGAKVNSSVREFTLRVAQSKNDMETISLIRNFPIPNAKEDVIEFMILAASNFSVENSLSDTGMRKEISDAWYAKFEQCYQKATLLFKNDEDFAKIEKIYDQGQKNITVVKKRKNVKSNLSLILRNIAVCVGLIIVIAAVIIDQTGGNASMVELIGYIVLIASASTLGKREAEMIDFGIGALSGVLTIVLSFLLDNGSMGELCGGIVLVIIAVNFFKSAGHKKA